MSVRDAQKRMLQRLAVLYPGPRIPMSSSRSLVLGFKARIGVCQYCYGRSLAPTIWLPSARQGHIAAQSIGEPGTQLTCHLHTGGL
jgi:hypothetical protein